MAMVKRVAGLSIRFAMPLIFTHGASRYTRQPTKSCWKAALLFNEAYAALRSGREMIVGDRMPIATGTAVKEPRVWDLLGQAGKQVVTIGVPGTFPPRPINGAQISCFLTPQTVGVDATGRRISKVFTHPPELSERVNGWSG